MGQVFVYVEMKVLNSCPFNSIIMVVNTDDIYVWNPEIGWDFMISSIMLLAAKNGYGNSSELSVSLINIWRRNVYQNAAYNSPLEILRSHVSKYFNPFAAGG